MALIETSLNVSQAFIVGLAQSTRIHSHASAMLTYMHLYIQTYIHAVVDDDEYSKSGFVGYSQIQLRQQTLVYNRERSEAY